MTPHAPRQRRKAVVDAAACTGCALCLDECPVAAIVLVNHVANIGEHCIGCGLCVQTCPNNAISLSETVSS